MRKTTADAAAAGGTERIVEQVKRRYAQLAEGHLPGCCAGGAGARTLELGYAPADLAQAPEGVDLGLGCGAPLAALELQAGETLLDLGSGAGLDAFLAARQVGDQGRVIGVDMTPAMLERARAAAARAALSNVEFREGRLEALPVADASVDAVTSNCVINLVPDKAAVFREVARVLRPGGRLVISDIVLDGALPKAVATDLMAYVGCLAGAAPRQVYFENLRDAGLAEVRILADVDYLDRVWSAAPDEVRALLERTGVDLDELRGKIRSLTFRALRPGAGPA